MAVCGLYKNLIIVKTGSTDKELWTCGILLMLGRDIKEGCNEEWSRELEEEKTRGKCSIVTFWGTDKGEEVTEIIEEEVEVGRTACP